MKDFEEKIELIFYFIHEYAVDNLNITSLEDINLHGRDVYIESVHTGFRKGQELILTELLSIEKEKNIFIQELKTNRKIRDFESEQIIQNKLKRLTFQESILRRHIDFIAWQLLGNQYHNARRFYDSRKKYNTRPSLLSSNIESVIDVVKHYHELHPKNFALIADLSTFIDIGDLLLYKDGTVIPMEVKEGVKNEEIFSFLEKLSRNDNECPLESIENPNDKFFEQVDRVLKQIDRGNKLSDCLKNEIGIDPFTNMRVHVNKEAFIMDKYFEDINQLLNELNTKNWSYTIVEDIITIGIYQKELLLMGDTLIPQLNKSMYGKDFPVVNYMQKLTIPISEPIFYQNFGKKRIFDLFFGRIRIVISINLDKFIEACNKNGLNARYLSKKETEQSKQKSQKNIFIWNKQGIIIDERVILGDGSIARMLFDFIRPSSIISTLVKGSDRQE